MAALFESHQARIFFHSGRVIAEKIGKETGSYWLVCESRNHHGFDYWGIIARIESLTMLHKLNGENA